MNVTHVGPPLARTGGPSGYLLQLSAAFDESPADGLVLRVPPPATPGVPSRRRSSGVRRLARRFRSFVFGPPQFYRPSLAEARRPGGAVGALLDEACAAMATANAPSVRAEVLDDADIVFCHDMVAAEAALERVSADRVWLMFHAPMPLGLYQAWSWALPEVDWRELIALPDVQRLVDRELDVCARVGRLIVPCPEAFDELVRVDQRFQSLRSRVHAVLTGGRRRAVAATASAAEIRARFGLPLDQPVGLFLGNREPYRGLDRLIEGVSALDEPRVFPGVIAVAGPDADAVPRSPRVRPLGRVDDVAALMTAVDFVVNVNRFSLFDLSLIEALEAGLPLLLHDTGGNRAFTRLGAGAVTLPDLHPTTVATGLEEMFTRRSSDMQHLAERSRASYERHLTLEAFRHGHRALYASAPRAACA